MAISIPPPKICPHCRQKQNIFNTSWECKFCRKSMLPPRPPAPSSSASSRTFYQERRTNTDSSRTAYTPGFYHRLDEDDYQEDTSFNQGSGGGAGSSRSFDNYSNDDNNSNDNSNDDFGSDD